MGIVYSKEALTQAVREATSVCEVLRNFGLEVTGSTNARISKLIRKFEIDTSHFLGRVPNRSARQPWQDILVLSETRDTRVASYRLRRALLESGRAYICECGQPPLWKGLELRLQVDHINGNWADNRAENLRFLCPNCHCQATLKAVSKGYTSVAGNKTPRSRTPKTPAVSESPKIRRERAKKPIPLELLSCACGQPKQKESPRCASCRVKSQERITWPPNELLKRLVWETPILQLSKQLGVSGKAIAKRCAGRGISVPPRGYWAKRAAGKL